MTGERRWRLRVIGLVLGAVILLGALVGGAYSIGANASRAAQSGVANTQVLREIAANSGARGRELAEIKSLLTFVKRAEAQGIGNTSVSNWIIAEIQAICHASGAACTPPPMTSAPG